MIFPSRARRNIKSKRKCWTACFNEKASNCRSFKYCKRSGWNKYTFYY
ncbi:hypothetical protein FHG64_16305 [Antarcticibacterium flavum]|uniref:Uncharacterized protein n=1 Tax=Antarcticibacterium flavum TaxID=2058175 RepID=A0A5B7X9S2_9FLAO|nr:hypothetical protein [Antarcticibacterium sp. W02-3]QCY71468.1 hypothetical protein FHG64_16305 [Antarcticibacterium flavum]